MKESDQRLKPPLGWPPEYIAPPPPIRVRVAYYFKYAWWKVACMFWSIRNAYLRARGR